MADNETDGTVTCTVVGMTDVGKVREHNEDNFLVINSSEGRQFGNGERVEFALDTAMLMAVADGMGGAAAGEVASLMAVDRFAKDLGSPDFIGSSPDQLAAKIDQTLQAANNDIKKHADENPERKGMGTTMTAAVVTPGQMFISQVGDSRGYLFRKGKLLRLTRDQSLIEQLIDEGTITEEEAERMGGRNIILQALGVEDTVRPDTKPFPVLRGDTYLLCSDGLSGMIKDEKMEEIVRDVGDDLVEGVTRLIQAANDNGGRDNITVVLARFEGEGLRAPMESVSQDDIEKTGVQFKAPPPPDVPNPMKKLSIVGLIIIAILAGLLATSGRDDVKLLVSIDPPTLEATLLLKNTETDEEITLAGVKGVAVFPELPLGKYVLTAKSPKHFDGEVPMDLDEPGDLEVTVALPPEPVGELTILLNEAGATVRLEREDGEEIQGVTAEKREAKFMDVPSTVPVVVIVEREGFDEYRETIVFPPADDADKTIDLVEQSGTLLIECTESGVAVEILDARGDERASGVTADGELELTGVRAGKGHTVRADKAGWERFSDKVDLGKGATVTVTVELSRPRRQVVFRSGGLVDLGKVQAQDEDGAWVAVKSASGRVHDVWVKTPGGASRQIDLVPGHYRLRFQRDGQWRTHSFDVEAGDGEQTVQVDG